MKINWFGHMYYGENKQYKMSLKQAFLCFWKWDILPRITGEIYQIENGVYKRYFYWTKGRGKLVRWAIGDSNDNHYHILRDGTIKKL